MSDYTKATNFTEKDSLLTGDPDKIVSGEEIDDEFDAIAVAVATKANKVSAATLNNLASLSAAGDLLDSGKASPAGAVVGTTDTQTLTNKTLTSPVINNPTITGYFAPEVVIDPRLLHYGTGADGAISHTTNTSISTREINATTFSVGGAATLTLTAPWTIIRATESITITGIINARGADMDTALQHSSRYTIGGLGGGGGGAPGTDAAYVVNGSTSSSTHILGTLTSGGTSTTGNTAGNGSAGTSTPESIVRFAIVNLFDCFAVSDGGAGANDYDVSGSVEKAGGAGGKGAGHVVLIAPEITITGAVNVSGQDGSESSAVGTTVGGAGGGGGGGTVIKISPSISDSGTITVTGGTGATGEFDSPLQGGNGGNGGAGHELEIDLTDYTITVVQ